MRIARHGAPGAERPVVSGADGVWRDLSSVVDDVTPATLARVLALGPGDVVALPEAAAADRVGPPVARPGKVVCIGVNYRAHAAETSHDEPSEPVVFLKTAQTVVGPDDEVLIPRGSTKTDWEVELAVVIGREARYLASPAEARACVAGYTISNDVSERELQLERGGTWDKGKNCETFNPLGPWIRTADEVPDPQALGLRLRVDGVGRQDSSTAAMIFGVDHLVWYLSQVMVLEPGDVINTGTPSGVALGLPDHPYLRPGNVVELEIDGLGRQRQTMGAA
ncbi:fumarylacetoacetate hydrolase family protein [Luteimicrobium sp. DT211]|uniref:fumarylacetoacetate hydrolase family protein n=1 Tax=Luteimicrobium sp. DT211 TaxID=3393412 RepID=UPI003CF6043C